MFNMLSWVLLFLTFTSYSGNIIESFTTNIAKFTFEPGYIRPYMTHGILNEETNSIKNESYFQVVFLTLMSIGAMLEHGEMTFFRQRS